ncbi:unnamed protein product [Miscanthus lutarioriparius]|uniref:RRM domain-containing protein n=1 Tax=Miscanthus lutarioriparius TaxID=422564 RepID=A0A811QLD5_9POAL|nr:unnamed protein product [Miscanthus lutarioriparius]
MAARQQMAARHPHSPAADNAQAAPSSLQVAVIKGKDGRNRGFAFVTMSTAEEAAAAAEKLNSRELMGRPARLNWWESGDDKVEVAKADSEVEVVNIEGASVDNASTDGGEDKQE